MQVPHFCGFWSGTDVVHQAFWHLMMRALVEKPTVFLVSKIRKAKLGNGCWSEWRNLGREEKGSLNSVYPCLGLAYEPCTYGEGSSSAKINYLNQDRSCCPKKHSLQFKPSQENCLLQQREEYVLEKSNEIQDLRKFTHGIQAVLHNNLTYDQEKRTHFQEKRN